MAQVSRIAFFFAVSLSAEVTVVMSHCSRTVFFLPVFVLYSFFLEIMAEVPNELLCCGSDANARGGYHRSLGLFGAVVC